MIISRKFKIYFITILLPLSYLVASCSSDLDVGAQENDLLVKLSAAISHSTVTRGYQASGKVMEGTYYLTYSNPFGNPQYNVGTVNFFDGTGFVTAPDGEELNWNKVGFDPGGNQNLATFYLDNVSYLNDNGEVTFDLPYDNQFKAGKFDYDNGTNDLLWGKQTVEREVSKVSLQLHHSMAMVRVMIIIDASAEGSIPPDLKNATVELTNIISSPVSYDRLTGNLGLGSDPEDYENLQLVVPEVIDWVTIENSELNDKITTFTAADFVLPPQPLSSGDLRPRLKVYIPQEDGSIRVFSGSLPRAMIVENNDGSTVSETFSFKREHILTLKVIMNPDLLELEFMPVTVIDWVNKGSYTLSGAQAAIYDESDFMNMIEFYNSANWTELERYGYKSGDSWIFNIYGDLTFYESDIFDQMIVKEGNPFSFRFNGQTVTIIRSDGSSLTLNNDNKNEEDLYKILQGVQI